jgi:hypothetical protein
LKRTYAYRERKVLYSASLLIIWSKE